MQQIKFRSSALSIWNKVPLIVRATVSGLFVSGAGVFAWGGMLSKFPTPWVVLPMTVVLWLYWKFFSGDWGRKDLREIRKENFRSTKLAPQLWKTGLIYAILFVVIVQSSFVVTFRLIEYPANKFTADYKILDSFPLWVAWVIIIMSSVVAGICEETGFRGYMQVPLEKKYGPAFGIILTSVFFTVIHLSHTWALPIVPHIFFASVLLGLIAYKTGSLIPGIIGHSILDVFDYSVWWSDITGGFTKQTIFRTGADLHFIFWVLVFLLSIFVFFWIMNREAKGV
jgi:membrane protease YdiL (CAAX protease family)